MPATFISYRRDDAAGYAGRLHEALERRLGEDQIFRDIDTLEPGLDFVDAIGTRLRECRVFLAIIGREWLDATDAAGHRRLEQSHDYVRLEIAVHSHDRRCVSSRCSSKARRCRLRRHCPKTFVRWLDATR